MKIVNIYGPAQSGKTVIIKTMVDKIVHDLGLKVLVINNALTNGDERAFTLPVGETSDVDIIRPFMVSGIITESLLQNVIIKVNPNVGVIRGSKLSTVEDKQILKIIDLTKGYDLAIIESRAHLEEYGRDITNVEIIPPLENEIRRVSKEIKPDTIYVLNRYDHEYLRIKPKSLNAIEIPTSPTLNMVINGYKYELDDDVSEAIDQIIDSLEGLDQIEGNPASVTKKSFLSKVRILTR